MDDLLQNLTRKLKEGAEASWEQIEKYGRIGKLKARGYNVRKKIDRNFLDIGERTYDLLESKKEDEIKGDLSIQNAIDNIKQLREQEADIEETIQQEHDNAEGVHHASDKQSDTGAEEHA